MENYLASRNEFKVFQSLNLNGIKLSREILKVSDFINSTEMEQVLHKENHLHCKYNQEKVGKMDKLVSSGFALIFLAKVSSLVLSSGKYFWLEGMKVRTNLK